MAHSTEDIIGLDASVSDPRIGCAGLPLVGRRPLSDDECGRLRRQALWPWRWGCSTLTVVGLLFAIMMIGDWEGGAEALITVPLLICAVAASFWIDAIKRARLASRALRDGHVYLFVGSVRNDETGEDEPHRIDLLFTGDALAIDGEQPDGPAMFTGTAQALAMQYGPGATRTMPWWPAGAEADGSQLWCYGLPRVAQRPLADIERAEVEQRYRHLVGRFWLLVLVPSGADIAAFAALTLTLGDASRWVSATALLGLPVWALGWAMAFDCWRRLRHLAGARQSGHLSAFVSRTNDQGVAFDPPFSLELLDGGLVWSANGYREQRVVVLRPVAVAPAPAAAELASQFMQPTQLADGVTVRLNRRPLDQAELAELRRMARPLRWWVGGVVMLAMAALSLRDMWLGASGQRTYLLISFVFFWIALKLFRVLAKQLVLYRAHRADVQGAFVVQLDPSESPEAAEAASIPAGTRYIEILPGSQRVWTVDGLPAAWRAQAGSGG